MSSSTAGAVPPLLVGLIVGLLPYHWKQASVADQVFWVVFLTGGGVLIIAGLRSFDRSPWLGAALISIGGLVGAVALFWTLAAPLAAIALIVLSVMNARRVSAAA